MDQRRGASRRRLTGQQMWTGALVAALLLIAAAAVLYFGRPATHDVPTVRVAHAGADGALSRELATNLTTDLQRLQQARSDRFALLDNSSGHADMEVAVAGTSSPTLLQANVTLKSDLEILWSSALEVPREQGAQIRQQLAARVAAILNCALDARPVDESRVDAVTLKLFLRACDGINFDRTTGAPERVIAALEQAVARNPNMAAAWSMLAHAQWFGDRGEAAVRKSLERAKQLDPRYALNFYTEALLLPPGSWAEHMSLADRAVAAAPGDAVAHLVRANALAAIGRSAEAVTQARLAAQLNPISQDVRLSYIDILASAGRVAEALAELDDADRTWPGDLALAQTRFGINMRYGDPREALRILDSSTGEIVPFSAWVEGGSAARVFLLARARPTRANVDAAIAAFGNMQTDEARRSAQLLQALATFGRIDEAAAMLKNPAAEQWKSGSDFLFRANLEPLRRRREFFELAERLGLVRFWRSTAKWPDFCRDPQLPYDCATGRVRSAPRSVV